MNDRVFEGIEYQTRAARNVVVLAQWITADGMNAAVEVLEAVAETVRDPVGMLAEIEATWNVGIAPDEFEAAWRGALVDLFSTANGGA